MNKQDVNRWCEQNNWTEPRQLTNGIWVAFPPGGLIETPLPKLPLYTTPSAELISSRITNVVYDIFYGLVLMIAAVMIAAIALVMSPLFLAIIINRYRKNQSMP